MTFANWLKDACRLPSFITLMAPLMMKRPAGKTPWLSIAAILYGGRARLIQVNDNPVPVGGATPGTRNYTKSLSWAMARTDFASMFAQLPHYERSYFNANPDRWVHYALVTAGLDNSGNTDQAAREFLVQARISDVYTLSNPVRIPVTRGMWLRDMALGINAIDRFSERGTNTSAMHTIDGTHRLVSLGKLGNTFDQVGLPKRGGENRRHPGVILELCQMRRRIPYTQWKQVALDVFDFTRQINNRSDKAGDPPVYFTGIS